MPPRTLIKPKLANYPASLAAADPLQIESIKVPRSVLLVLSIIGASRLRSRAFMIREVLTQAATKFMEDAAVRERVEKAATSKGTAGKVMEQGGRERAQASRRRASKAA